MTIGFEFKKSVAKMTHPANNDRPSTRKIRKLAVNFIAAIASQENGYQ
jgi:hypothetical protein